MKLSYLALALGTFGLGMTEYGMMGILPDLAQDIKVPIPVAGHFISYYAIGVCVGAPLMVIVARKLSLKNILLLLMAIFILGNLAFSLSHSYASMSVWRFIAGFPHGAYFGVGSIVASQQILVLKNSKGGEMLGGSLAQIGFNLGNAIGAYVGGIPVTMGYSYEYTAVPGVFLAIFGFMLLFTYSRNEKIFQKQQIKVL